jgi:flagellar biosynthetic protein FliP
MMRLVTALLVLLLALPEAALAQAGLTAVTVTQAPGGGQTYSVSIQVLILMTVLTMLPAALLMMTSFTRLVIVFAILRQALGTQQTPSNQVIVGLSLFLTFFIMMPVFDTFYEDALAPYMDEKISVQQALEQAEKPFRAFMLRQTREDDIGLFANMSGRDQLESPAEVPFSVLVPAFVTSELKTAFQIGFLVFIPFLIIDLVVASVLMSMGMMMLSPMLVSLPFKIMLFVLIDGWSLIMATLASSFF